MTHLLNKLKEKRLFLLYIPLVIYWMILFTLTTLPGGNELPSVLLYDKFNHFSAYLILASMLGLVLRFQTRLPKVSKNYFWITFVVIAVYGGLDEIHQIFVPNRYCEFFDWIADLLGGFLGLFLVHLYLKRNVSMLK